MFGYVRPFKGEMLVKEYEAYKAVYCELCKALGKHYGVLARLALSYDCTFYAMLALHATGAPLAAKRGRCTCNPMKRCTFLCPAENGGLAEACYQKAAALCVIMTVYKLRDNIADESLPKRLAARALLLITKRAMKRATADFPDLSEAVRRMTEAQAEAEKADAISVDRCAAPTAELLETLCADLAGEDAAKRRVLGQAGYFLGRWVYLMDAADDLPEDLEAGRFNPFIQTLQLSNHVGKTLQDPERKAAETEMNAVLNATLARMYEALNLLEAGPFSGEIENILRLGLPEMQREILFMRVKEKRNGRSV